MLLFRLILLFAVAFIAWRLYRMVMAPRMRGPEQPPSLRGEVMVECAFCSVHVPVSYTHLRAHETVLDLVCRLLLEKKKLQSTNTRLSVAI